MTRICFVVENNVPSDTFLHLTSHDTLQHPHIVFAAQLENMQNVCQRSVLGVSEFAKAGSHWSPLVLMSSSSCNH